MLAPSAASSTNATAVLRQPAVQSSGRQRAPSALAAAATIDGFSQTNRSPCFLCSRPPFELQE
jgi:hypothetical protein